MSATLPGMDRKGECEASSVCSVVRLPGMRHRRRFQALGDGLVGGLALGSDRFRDRIWDAVSSAGASVEGRGAPIDIVDDVDLRDVLAKQPQ
jgi:hypothetical protein